MKKLSLVVLSLLALCLNSCSSKQEFNTTMNMVGRAYEDIVAVLDTDYLENTVNSMSAKTHMPSYLADYLSSGEQMREARLLRWKEGSVFHEVTFINKNGIWIAFGYTQHMIDQSE